MLQILIWGAALWSAQSYSSELLTLDELSIDYKNHAMLNPNDRSPLLYPEHTKESINVNIDTTVFIFGYWNNKIKSNTTAGQYRSIALETEAGFRLNDQFDVFVYHESQHLLDRHHTYIDRFPVTDAVGIRIYLFRDDHRKSVF